MTRRGTTFAVAAWLEAGCYRAVRMVKAVRSFKRLGVRRRVEEGGRSARANTAIFERRERLELAPWRSLLSRGEGLVSEGRLSSDQKSVSSKNAASKGY